MVEEKIISELAEIKVTLAEISNELRSIRQRVERNEGYTHHVNKRLLDAEKNLSWLKGVIYFFIASGIITLCSVALQRVILSM